MLTRNTSRQWHHEAIIFLLLLPTIILSTSNGLSVQPVAISDDGERALMGSSFHYQTHNTTEKKTVKVLEWDGAAWVTVGSFTGSDEHYFGRGIAMSRNGRRIAIGSGGGVISKHKQKKRSVVNTSVQIYENIKGNTWIPFGNKLIGLERHGYFGWAISMSENGNIVAVPTPWGDVNGTNKGYVQMFHFADGGWKQKGNIIVGEANGDRFGYAVSLSADGGIVAISAPWSDENGDQCGSVRVFRYVINENEEGEENEGEWIQLGQKLQGSAGDYAGRSLSINANGDALAIGSTYYKNNLVGYVAVYRLNHLSTLWEPMGQPHIGDKEGTYGFSVSLAPKAHRIAISNSDATGGNVKVMHYDHKNNHWIQIGNLPAPSLQTYYGSSVALSSRGNRVAIGSVYNDGIEKGGQMFVFAFD